MAGLFSKKTKKDKDDKAGSRDNVSGNGNFQYNNDNSSSANNSITNSDLPSTTHSHPSHNNHPYTQSFSSKNSLEGDKARYHHQQQQQHLSHQHHNQHNQHRNLHQGSQGSLSTFNSMANQSLSSTGPWSSALVMSTNPFPRFAHTASYISTGTDMYIFGGMVKGSPQKDVHVIDFRKHTFHC